jgi:hypothetical protein
MATMATVAAEQTAQQTAAAMTAVAAAAAVTTMAAEQPAATMAAAVAAVAAVAAAAMAGDRRGVGAQESDAHQSHKNRDSEDQSTIHPRILQQQVQYGKQFPIVGLPRRPRWPAECTAALFRSAEKLVRIVGGLRVVSQP